MESAAVSVRQKRWARKVAQIILISHIKDYFRRTIKIGGLVVGLGFPDDPEGGYIMSLPRWRDYSSLLRDIEDMGGISIDHEGQGGRLFIAVPNIYITRDQKGRLSEKTRPGDKEKFGRAGMRVPRIAYIVANKNDLTPKKINGYHCRDMKKLLHNALALGALFELNKELERDAHKEKVEQMSYDDHLKANQPRNKTVIKSHTQGRVGRPKIISPEKVIQREIFKNNRKEFSRAKKTFRTLGITWG